VVGAGVVDVEAEKLATITASLSADPETRGIC